MCVLYDLLDEALLVLLAWGLTERAEASEYDDENTD